MIILSTVYKGKIVSVALSEETAERLRKFAVSRGSTNGDCSDVLHSICGCYEKLTEDLVREHLFCSGF